MQGEDAQGTVALMEAKIRRLQGIITRNQPQEELNLRTIHSLEQVPLSSCHARRLERLSQSALVLSAHICADLPSCPPAQSSAFAGCRVTSAGGGPGG